MFRRHFIYNKVQQIKKFVSENEFKKRAIIIIIIIIIIVCILAITII